MAIACPSGENELGMSFPLSGPFVIASAAPLPSADCQQRRFPAPLKTIRLSSGVQTGSTFRSPSKVKRVNVSAKIVQPDLAVRFFDRSRHAPPIGRNSRHDVVVHRGRHWLF